MIDTMRVKAPDGVSSAARVAGTKGPALVFVHGVGSTAAIWDSQLAAFSKTNRCFAIELRGNGVPKPEPDPALITREGYVADVLAIMDSVRISRFTLVGCSLGGVVGFELWKRVPQRIAALTIVGSFARYPDAQAYADGVKNGAKLAGDMRTFARERAGKLGLPPDRMSETLDQMACKALPSYLAATQATWTGDYRALLPTIAVPTWVVCGENDKVAPLALSREIADAIPGATLSVIPGAGHVTNADAPKIFNDGLREFLLRAKIA